MRNLKEILGNIEERVEKVIIEKPWQAFQNTDNVYILPNSIDSILAVKGTKTEEVGYASLFFLINNSRGKEFEGEAVQYIIEQR